MTVQTTYGETPAVAFAGMLAEDFSVRQVDSFLADGAVPVGYAVKRGSTATEAAVLTAASDVVVGIALAASYIENASGALTYADNTSLPVISKGRVWVTVGETVAINDSVFAGMPTAQVSTLVFSADLVTSNVCTVTINGNTVLAYTFASTHDASMTAIAAEIALDSRVATAVAAVRTITITGNDAGDAFPVAALVTDGGSQATAVHTVTNSATAQTGKFYNDAASTTRAPVKGKFRTVGATDGSLAMIELWETN